MITSRVCKGEFGAIAIGRNEGERLKQCLLSLSRAGAVVYVDSGSTDGSTALACEQGLEVVRLDSALPFTAARARNAGFRRLREIAPHLTYAQFVDGDCQLIEGWVEQAIAFMKSNPNVGAVCGRRRERYPDRSIYNWLCDQEWNGPVGEVRAFGGDVMLRMNALEAVGGYREDVIAGEEPELSVRLRKAGWRVWRLDSEMTLHDAAMIRFGQWWRRATRSGYAFALGAYLHGAKPERHWVWESRRAWLWGVWWPLGCAASAVLLGPWGWAATLAYPALMVRQTARNGGSLGNRATLAFFQVLSRVPEGWGQIRFIGDRMLGRQARLFEYK